MVEVVEPVLQENVLATVAPACVAVKVAGSALAHCSTSPTETVGFGSTVRVPEPEPVQPFVSVTVTLYVPAVLDAKVGAPVPPAGVAVKVAVSVLAQTSTFAFETVGFGLTVRVPEPVQ